MKAIAILFLLATVASAQSWTKRENKDALTGETSLQFGIQGKFLTAPQHGKLDQPVLSLICSAGKLKSVGVGIGAPVDLIELDRTIVKYRRDDGEPKEDAWMVSSDLSSVEPFADTISQMLPARKLVLATSELQGSNIVIEFDLPEMTEVVIQCGLAIDQK